MFRCPKLLDSRHKLKRSASASPGESLSLSAGLTPDYHADRKLSMDDALRGNSFWYDSPTSHNSSSSSSALGSFAEQSPNRTTGLNLSFSGKLSSAVMSWTNSSSIMSLSSSQGSGTKFYDSQSFDFLKVPPEDFASQLTYVSFPIFKSITRAELSSLGWNTSRKATLSPNVVAFTKQVSRYFATLCLFFCFSSRNFVFEVQSHFLLDYRNHFKRRQWK